MSGTNSINVVVTGVGAIIGQGVIKSLRDSVYSVKVFGVDKNPDSIGQCFCDEFITKPVCDESSSDYIEFWNHLCDEFNIDLIIPALEQDVVFFNENRTIFDSKKTKVVLNTAELIDLSIDKLKFINSICNCDVPVIPTIDKGSWSDIQSVLGEPPYLIKPRRGSGSKGIQIIHDEIDYEYWSLKSESEFITQKIIGDSDKEYTVGYFGTKESGYHDLIIFRRKLSVMGSTQFAEVVRQPDIIEATLKLIDRFKPVGPTNFQFRVENDSAYILEINPRVSSSTSLRTLFGYNESEMCLDYFLFNKSPESVKIKGGRAWRYLEDYVSYDSGYI